MTVSPGDVIRVTARMDMSGDAIQNVYHVLHEGTGDVSDVDFMDAVAQELDDSYDYIDAQQASAVDYIDIYGFNLTADAPLPITAWPSMTVGGDAVNAAYAKQVAPLIRFGTAAPRSQGRKYLGGFTVDNFTGGGVVAGALITTLTNMASNLLAGFTAQGEDFVFGNWSELYTRFAPWIEAFVNAYAQTQRRRVIGKGD